MDSLVVTGSKPKKGIVVGLGESRGLMPKVFDFREREETEDEGLAKVLKDMMTGDLASEDLSASPKQLLSKPKSRPSSATKTGSLPSPKQQKLSSSETADNTTANKMRPKSRSSSTHEAPTTPPPPEPLKHLENVSAARTALPEPKLPPSPKERPSSRSAARESSLSPKSLRPQSSGPGNERTASQGGETVDFPVKSPEPASRVKTFAIPGLSEDCMRCPPKAKAQDTIEDKSKPHIGPKPL